MTTRPIPEPADALDPAGAPDPAGTASRADALDPAGAPDPAGAASRADVTDTHALADELLGAARDATAGRAARALRAGRGRVLHQTVLALVAGASLDEHENPGEATLFALRGRVRLHAGDEAWVLGPGEWAEVPPSRHALDALDDSVVVLTTVTQR